MAAKVNASTIRARKYFKIIGKKKEHRTAEDLENMAEYLSFSEQIVPAPPVFEKDVDQLVARLSRSPSARRPQSVTDGDTLTLPSVDEARRCESVPPMPQRGDLLTPLPLASPSATGVSTPRSRTAEGPRSEASAARSSASRSTAHSRSRSQPRRPGSQLGQADLHSADFHGFTPPGSPRPSSTPRASSVSPFEWREDDKHRAWCESIQRRRQMDAVKKVRAASKEAQWVLTHRERQMKEIQRRQKAEQEAESRARKAQSLKNVKSKFHGSDALQKFKRQTMMLGALMRKPNPAKKPPPVPMKKEPEIVILPPSGPEYGPTLPWIKMAEKSQPPQKKDVPIWVKPGVFITKTVVVPRH